MTNCYLGRMRVHFLLVVSEGLRKLNTGRQKILLNKKRIARGSADMPTATMEGKTPQDR